MGEPVGSSAWWLDRLGRELDSRATTMRRLGDYYSGRQPLQLASKKFRDAFGQTYGRFSDNFTALVVQAVEERLTIEGFRFGDDPGSRRAWAIWQGNQLDAQSQRAHREALIKGDCPIIVGPDPNGGRMPVIRIQKPDEVVVAQADDPLIRAVALKRWAAIDGRVLATLYFPDRLEKYVRSSAGSSWEVRMVPGEPWPLPHALGAVPVVSLVNDPDLDGHGTSEIASVVPLQDALNKLLVDMLVASEFASFRQRWVTGMEIPTDPETGKPVELFRAAVDRVWQARDKDVKFGDFAETDLGPYIRAIETVIQHIASTTRTPAHYLLGQAGTFPSGESLKSVETGLVAKARRRMRDYGEVWEETMRLGFRAVGDLRRGTFDAAETIWRDPESRTEAQHVDALVKLSTIGVPREQLWADAGYTPEQIRQFQVMFAAPPTPGAAAPTEPSAAVAMIQQAVALHQAHMNGTEPTSPESQKRLMDLLQGALTAASGSAPGSPMMGG